MQHKQFQFLTNAIDKSLAFDGSYDLLLVLLSVFIASFAAYSALLITERLIGISDKKIKKTWLIIGAFAMGIGVWSMHFVGMLAFKLPVAVGYDPFITAISAVPSVIASWIALHFMCQEKIGFWKLNLGGVLMGVGIGTMHYTGMAAMIMNSKMYYDPLLFTLSIVVAHILATFALFIKFAFSRKLTKYKQMVHIVSSFVMGCAVAGMHYTGMKAAFYFPVEDMGKAIDPFVQGMDPSILAFLVTSIATIFISFVILGATVGDDKTFKVQYPLSLKISIGFGVMLLLFLTVQITVQSNLSTITKQFSIIVEQDVKEGSNTDYIRKLVGDGKETQKDLVITEENKIIDNIRNKINVFIEKEKIFTLQDKQKALAKATTTKKLGYFLMIISALLVVIITIIFIRGINKSLFRIIAASQIMSKGDLETEIATTYNDEFGVLAQTFEEMRIQLKKSYTDLKVSKESLDQILASAGEAIMITDQDGTIEYINAAFEKITNYKREDIIGKNPRILNSGKQDPVFFKNMWGKIKKGEVWGGTLVNKKADGTFFDTEETIAPVKNSEGKISKFVSIMRDITNRKIIEKKLENTNQELMESEKKTQKTLTDLRKAHEDLKNVQNQLLQSEKLASIGQLAAGVAHEINNPVGFIGSNIQSLEEYVKAYSNIIFVVEKIKQAVESGDINQAKATVKELKEVEEKVNLSFIMNDVDSLLQESHRGVERVKKIVLDLKTFSREDSEEKELFQIEAIIDSVLSMLHNELKYKVDVRKEYSETPQVKCHTQRLGQVFVNLLVNAVHSIEEKGIITIKTFQEDDNVCVEISDTGRGISKENLIKIFDAFFTTKKVGQGTGLGLSISHEIIKKHGGEMTVKSEVNKGTTFKIKLPINELHHS